MEVRSACGILSGFFIALCRSVLFHDQSVTLGLVLALCPCRPPLTGSKGQAPMINW